MERERRQVTHASERAREIWSRELVGELLSAAEAVEQFLAAALAFSMRR